eukprot:132366-Prorocentrum_minimum.AAC.1
MQTAFSDGFPILLTSEDSLEGETNQTQAVRVYSHDGPIRYRQCGYILTIEPAESTASSFPIARHPYPNSDPNPKPNPNPDPYHWRRRREKDSKPLAVSSLGFSRPVNSPGCPVNRSAADLNSPGCPVNRSAADLN